MFSMSVAEPEVIEREIEAELKPVPEETQKLHAQAAQNAEALMNLSMDSLPERQQFVASIESFGADSLQKSTAKNDLLKVSVGKLAQSGQEGGEVSRSLIELQHEIKGLDPSAMDFAKKGLFGKLTNPIRGYFEKYEKSETVIANIITSLDKGKQTLKNDNTTLAIEEQNLREVTQRIQKEIEMGVHMDACIAQKIEEQQATGGDPDKIRFVQEEILFPLRQRVMDLQQMIVVNQQGIVAMEIIRRNNKELMRGVDRAKTVTVSALRTAVMVASALYNQKIVLQKIEALNQTTNNLIGATSRMLKDQGAEIHRQSMEATVSPEVLQQSFKDLTEALDSISTYKQQALPLMQKNIETFRALAEKGEVEIRKLERGSALAIDS